MTRNNGTDWHPTDVHISCQGSQGFCWSNTTLRGKPKKKQHTPTLTFVIQSHPCGQMVIRETQPASGTSQNNVRCGQRHSKAPRWPPQGQERDELRSAPLFSELCTVERGPFQSLSPPPGRMPPISWRVVGRVCDSGSNNCRTPRSWPHKERSPAAAGREKVPSSRLDVFQMARDKALLCFEVQAHCTRSRSSFVCPRRQTYVVACGATIFEKQDSPSCAAQYVRFDSGNVLTMNRILGP